MIFNKPATAFAFACGLPALAAACAPNSAEQPAAPPAATATEVVQPIKLAEAPPAPPAPPPAPKPAPPPVGPTTFLYDGALTQGGWLRGQVPAGTKSAKLGEQALEFDEQGMFFAAFDRDAAKEQDLVATLADGRLIRAPLSVSAREWNIQHVNIARNPGGASASFMERRRPELERIAAARAADSQIAGWREDFIWPVTGRISGHFGRQRIYRGEPGSYHSGIDIAKPAGTPFVAPAAGVVTLASREEFSLEGRIVIIDHGAGLNSAFIHMTEIAVKEGERVKQGQLLGTIGSSGRATGPHLHWSLKWHDARLDPLLFTGPMP